MYNKSLFPFQLQAQFVMVIFVWWAAPKTGRVELRCTCQELGALLEIAPGLMRMLRLCAGSWDTQIKVRFVHNLLNMYTIQCVYIALR